eukprot:scaffold95715_cov69-Phaeocystis_antarctica.AAC.4
MAHAEGSTTCCHWRLRGLKRSSGVRGAAQARCRACQAAGAARKLWRHTHECGTVAMPPLHLESVGAVSVDCHENVQRGDRLIRVRVRVGVRGRVRVGVKVEW